jgi:hypothetical protein
MSAPSLCTMNFLFNATGRFEDGGPFYLGTAKHCVGGGDPRGKPVRVWVALGSDQPVDLEIGTVSHATKGTTDSDRDYALVRIKPELEALLSPSIAVVGGPTSVYDETLGADPVTMVGHGACLGAGGTPRVGVLTCACPDDKPYAWAAAMPVIAGDSGSPVRTLSGAAVGDVITDATNYYLGEPPPGGTTVMGTRVTRVSAEWGLRVVTCATATPWPGFGCPPA